MMTLYSKFLSGLLGVFMFYGIQVYFNSFEIFFSCTEITDYVYKVYSTSIMIYCVLLDVVLFWNKFNFFNSILIHFVNLDIHLILAGVFVDFYLL